MECGCPVARVWERPGVGGLRLLGREGAREGGGEIPGAEVGGGVLGDDWGPASRLLYVVGMDSWVPVVERAGGGG